MSPPSLPPAVQRAEPAAGKEIELARDAMGRLVLTFPDGSTHAGVVPVRCFPFSAPEEWISLCEEGGAEVHCLPSLAGLSRETLAVLRAELERRELVPVIQHVRSISPGAEPTSWQVDTDRGQTSFTLPSEDNVRRLGEHGALITDAHGVRFRILDTRALDGRSRKFLAQYL